MTETTLQKLEQAFLMGCTDLEACLYADIAPSTLYAYQQGDDKFSERKAALKTNPVMKARNVILGALDDGDLQTAHKVIDRVEGSKINLDARLSGSLETITKVERVIVNATNTDS